MCLRGKVFPPISHRLEASNEMGVGVGGVKKDKSILNDYFRKFSLYALDRKSMPHKCVSLNQNINSLPGVLVSCDPKT